MDRIYCCCRAVIWVSYCRVSEKTVYSAVCSTFLRASDITVSEATDYGDVSSAVHWMIELDSK